MAENVKRIHFVGIGGAGMNGLAEILLTWGIKSAALMQKSPIPAENKVNGRKGFHRP